LSAWLRIDGRKKRPRRGCTLTGLRQLIDTANAPLFGIDVDGNVNEWNNKTAEINALQA
jgi:PAS domain-containing protein